MSYQGPRFLNVQSDDDENYVVTDNTTGLLVLWALGIAALSFAMPVVLPVFILWRSRSWGFFLISIPTTIILWMGAIFLSTRFNWQHIPPHIGPGWDEAVPFFLSLIHI